MSVLLPKRLNSKRESCATLFEAQDMLNGKFSLYRKAPILSTQKLTESSWPIVLPWKKLQSGEISAKDNAKMVWESESNFTKHKLENICAKFNHPKVEGDKTEDDPVKILFIVFSVL